MLSTFSVLLDTKRLAPLRQGIFLLLETSPLTPFVP